MKKNNVSLISDKEVTEREKFVKAVQLLKEVAEGNDRRIEFVFLGKMPNKGKDKGNGVDLNGAYSEGEDEKSLRVVIQAIEKEAEKAKK